MTDLANFYLTLPPPLQLALGLALGLGLLALVVVLRELLPWLVDKGRGLFPKEPPIELPQDGYDLCDCQFCQEWRRKEAEDLAAPPSPSIRIAASQTSPWKL